MLKQRAPKPYKLLIFFYDFCDTLTGLFNNMWTLKFKGQPANAFFAAVNQMFGGSSQLTTTAKHCFVVWTVHNDLITACSAVVGSWEETKNIRLTVAKNAFVRWALNFRVRILLKGAVKMGQHTWYSSQLLSNGSWMTGLYSCHKTDTNNLRLCIVYFRGQCFNILRRFYEFSTMFQGL